MSDDKALILAAQNGNTDAFEVLIERYYDTLYRFAYAWCGERADAEDVTQQACLRIADSLPQFQFRAAFTSWLYRVVVSCAQDWSRRQRRHRGAASDSLAEIPEGGASVETRAYHWQLLESLEALPEGMKETLLLVHVQGLSHAETARVLGVSEGTVSWRLHEYRKRHRAVLDKGGELRDGS